MTETGDRFWERKTLADMTAQEWESLCDGCGRCCLIKIEDETTGRYYHTDIACRLFDKSACRCSDYVNRDAQVPDCVRLSPGNVGELAWMPPTCAYRLIHEGKGLLPWHPLVSGDPQSVIEAGVSVKGRVHGLENDFTLEAMIGRIRAWPGRWPAKARAQPAGGRRPVVKVTR